MKHPQARLDSRHARLAIPTIEALLHDHLSQRRQPISVMFPVLKEPITRARQAVRKVKNTLSLGLTNHVHFFFLPETLMHHESLLRRKLGTCDPKLQEQKITNLRIAAKKINGILLYPGQSFSFWNTVGRPTKARGFAEGLILKNGQQGVGVGGGLCQMSNLLYWMFLHTGVTITERHHHSRDVFPDSGRVLPFGSGATVFYNYLDLKMTNTTDQPIQIKIWLSDTHVHGEIRAMKPAAKKFHVIERNHCFVSHDNNYYRYNEIWREVTDKRTGNVLASEHITTNFAPVLYPITADYCVERSYQQVSLHLNLAA